MIGTEHTGIDVNNIVGLQVELRCSQIRKGRPRRLQITMSQWLRGIELSAEMITCTNNIDGISLVIDKLIIKADTNHWVIGTPLVSDFTYAQYSEKS